MPYNADKERVPILEAARRLGMGPDKLRSKLRHSTLKGIYCPIGFSFPPSTKNGQWDDIIPRERFEMYMKGLDLVRPGKDEL